MGLKKPAGRILYRVLWKAVLALLLAYGALQLAARSNVFRSRVEAELSRVTGMPVRVGRIRATESLNLRIRDVISVSEEAGFEARLIRVRWRIFRPRGEPVLESVRVDGVALTFAPDADGVIQPAFLGNYARTAFEWAGVRLPEPEKSEGSAPPVKDPVWAVAAGKAPRILLRGMSVRFVDARGNLQGSMRGMDVSWTAMALPEGGRMAYASCRAEEVRVANGARIMGLRVKLIDTGERQYLAGLDADNWGAMRAARSKEDEYRQMLDAMDSDLR